MNRVAVGWLTTAAGVIWVSVGPAAAQAPKADEYISKASTKTMIVERRPAEAPPCLPFDKMPEAVRDRVRQVVEGATLATHGTPEIFACKPAQYYWFLDHPDRASIAWQRLGAKCMEVNDRGDGRFGWIDGQGSDIHWDTVFRGPRMRVWYAEGKVRPAALLPLVPVRAVFVLQHAEGHGESGRLLLRHHADLYLYTDSKTAAWLTRMLGASAPRIAEQYVGQLQMFFAALAWHFDQHPDQAAGLLATEK